MVQSMAVVFSSPYRGANVEKHFKDLQSRLEKHRFRNDDPHGKSQLNVEDLKVNASSGCVKAFTFTL